MRMETGRSIHKRNAGPVGTPSANMQVGRELNRQLVLSNLLHLPSCPGSDAFAARISIFATLIDFFLVPWLGLAECVRRKRQRRLQRELPWYQHQRPRTSLSTGDLPL